VPVWHSSIALARDTEPSPKRMRRLALRHLEGVGDATSGQWEEWTGRAFHLRRRLAAKEQQIVGPAIDCRNTEEAIVRLRAARLLLPPAGWTLALEEIQSLAS